MELITHLRTTYGTISEADIDANNERMKEQWDHTSTIEVLFDHFKTGNHYATVGSDPLYDLLIIRIAYNSIGENDMPRMAQ
jgi:hypothetical protein